MNEYIEQVIQTVRQQDADKPEFIQTVEEVFHSLEKLVEQHPEYQKNAILERMVEPDRFISFRVAWTDDQGKFYVPGETVTFVFSERPEVTFTARWAQTLGLGTVWLEAGVPYQFGPSLYRVSGNETAAYRHYKIEGDDQTLYKGGAVFYVPESGYYTITMAD